MGCQKECDNCPPGNPRPANSKDHIFPKYLRKKHGPIFNQLIDREVNLYRVCPQCHTGIDEGEYGKIATISDFGVLGAILYTAIIYPRATTNDGLEAQRLQWMQLFTEYKETVETSSNRCRHSDPRGFDESIPIAKEFLGRWQVGLFVPDRDVLSLVPAHYKWYFKAALRQRSEQVQDFDKILCPKLSISREPVLVNCAL